MKMPVQFKCFTMAAILLSGVSLPALAQTVLGQRVLASGGRTVSANSQVLKVTLGQTITGKCSAGDIFSGLGFWEQIVFDSSTAVENMSPLAPTCLHQNVPNPFNPSTTVYFTLASTEMVRMDVFDLQGRRVARLLDTSLPAGEHSLLFRPDGLASGVYLLRLKAGGYHENRRLVLLK